MHNDSGLKLDVQAIEGHWVGYDKDSTHAHRIYILSKNSIAVEQNVRFVPTDVTIHTGPTPANSSLTPPSALPPVLPPVQTTTDLGPPPLAQDDEDEQDEEGGEEEQGRGEEEAQDPALPGQYQSPTVNKSKTPRSQPKTSGPSYTQPTRTSSRKSKPGEVERRIEAGEGTTDGRPTSSTKALQPKKPKKVRRASAAIIDDFLEFGVNCEFIATAAPLIAQAISKTQGDPQSVDEARSRSDWPLWQEAMDREMKTLEDAGTWETVPRPTDHNIIGSKWVFRLKRKSDGSIDKYKARLVARGFTQVYGTDYFETYSPVAKLSTFCTILALAAQQDWDIDSFDFNGAYLNGELGENEDIYMQNPPGYDIGEGTVKHLKKSLYGLKQAGRKWYDTLKRTLADLGFRVSDVDPGVFYLYATEYPVIIAVHVNDCAITSSSRGALEDYKRKINARHSITDLGPIHWLLGIKITRDRDSRILALSQESYIDNIIHKFNLSDAKPINTPMIPGISYSAHDGPADETEAAHMAKVPYWEAIGSLMYASVATRPDISFTVSTLSQFLENPGEAH